MKAGRVLIAAAMVVLGLASAGRADGKIEPTGPFAGPASESIQAALAPAGQRVTLADGTVAADIWWVKDAGELKQGALLGVVTFAKPWQDCRGQVIPAGSYTLRHSTMPSDGNHMGAAPTNDFVLLSALAADKDAAATPAFRELFEQSAKSVGSAHAASLNLTEVGAREVFPAVELNDHKQDVLFVKLKTAKGELPIALALRGQPEQ